MRFATAFSENVHVSEAFAETFSALCARLGSAPDLVILAYTQDYDADELARLAAALPASVRIHGASSCLGAMTEAGYHGKQTDRALAMFGIADPTGSYGVAGAPLDIGPRSAGATAIRRALGEAARPGEVPAFVWLNAAPGSEEDVLLGIEDVLGPNVPIYGGSSAANAITGGWSQLERGVVHRNGVLVSVLFPSGDVSYAFSSGYAPTEKKGRVTRAGRRVAHEIDSVPAAVVYNEWTGGVIAGALGGGDVVMLSTLHPIGRIVASIEGVPYYLLIHPNLVTADNSLTFGADVNVGDELVLMTGSRDKLAARVQGVAEVAWEAAGRSSFQPEGALVIFCAGCMMAVRSEMDRIVVGLRELLGSVPFLGAFTFGEQGSIVQGKNRHGNLLISVMLFGSSSGRD